MRELRKERPLEIAEALVNLYSSDDYDLDFVVEDILEHDHCDVYSVIIETVENHVKENALKYGTEHKRKMMLNKILLDAYDKEKKNKSSINVNYSDDVTIPQDLYEFYGVREDEFESLETVLEDKEKSLLKNISMQELMEDNKEDIITDIKKNEELKKYIEDVVDYALDFKSLIKSEKEDLKKLEDETVDEEDKEEQESFINFNIGFIEYLERLDNDKSNLVPLYANKIINNVIKRFFDWDILDDNDELKEEIIDIIAKDLKKNPMNIDIDDVINYYNEYSDKLQTKGIFIPEDDYMIHVIRKLYNDDYKANVDGEKYGNSIDYYFTELERIDSEIRDRTDYENDVFGSKHKQRGIFKKF